MSVGGVAERTDRPAIVRFETEAIEDREATIEQGKFIGRDVDYALITPPYSKDVIKIKVTQWFQNMAQDVAMGRLPAEWEEKYRESHRRWKAGQQIPLDGTPIRGWLTLSPKQQQLLISLNILTIEDLAGINNEGLTRIGMGALDLKNKAIAALRAVKDSGGLTLENAALKRQTEQQAQTIENQERLIAQLRAQVGSPDVAADPHPIEVILADDILPEDAVKPRRGRPPRAAQ